MDRYFLYVDIDKILKWLQIIRWEVVKVKKSPQQILKMPKEGHTKVLRSRANFY